MACLRPFRALRPRAALAARVAAVPYDVVDVDEARALAGDDPLSFLRISRPELELPDHVDPYADEVYTRAAANFRRLRDEAMEVEAAPSVYCYRLTMGGHRQTGLAACYSLEDYAHDVIKKHEKTRRDKEDDRTRHIVELRAQTGPVFLTYRRHAAVDALVGEICLAEPLYRFEAPDGVEHAIWRASADAGARIATAMGEVPALYIADGHHRAASAARAHEHFAAREPSREAAHAWFLAVAFPDDQTRILPYHRLIKSIGARTPGDVLREVGRIVSVRSGGPVPGGRGECCMYLDGAWHTLSLAGAAADDAVSSLDVSVLQDRIIEPVFGITDVRTDKRIEFAGGIRGTAELERRVDAGSAVVAFSMHPVTVDDLMRVSDAGAIMPPKSTWFEPKLRDGLLVHQI